MLSHWNRISVKIPAIGITMIALSSGLISWRLYNNEKSDLETIIGRELIGIAATGALQIDADMHEDIYVEDDGTLVGQDSFETIRTVLNRILENNHLEKPIYTLRKSYDFESTGEVEFVVMTDEQNGKPYSGNRLRATPYILSVYENGQPLATPLYSDEEGTWISGLAPIKGDDGEVIAVLSCDRGVGFFQKALSHTRATIFGTAGVSLLVGAVCFVLLSGPIVRRIQDLTSGVELVGKGNFERRIELRMASPEQRDELDELAVAFNQMVGGLEERDRIRGLLGKVVDPKIAEELLAHQSLDLGGEEREVTILFSDIRDFTTLSENRTPSEVLRFLNMYLTQMGQVIEHHGGVVDKYVGDAIMAMWGAPLIHDDDVDCALNAAIEMVRELESFNRMLKDTEWPQIKIGIGIHTGVVVAGNIGSPERLNYTVIGDGVNLASRLESLTKTKEYATSVIISESTLAKARTSYATRDLGTVMVKGRQSGTRIFALDGQADS